MGEWENGRMREWENEGMREGRMGEGSTLGGVPEAVSVEEVEKVE